MKRWPALAPCRRGRRRIGGNDGMVITGRGTSCSALRAWWTRRTTMRNSATTVAVGSPDAVGPVRVPGRILRYALVSCGSPR